MTLYEAGKDAMEKEFRNLLARHGRPVPPGSLLDVLALEHGNHSHLQLLILLVLLLLTTPAWRPLVNTLEIFMIVAVVY